MKIIYLILGLLFSASVYAEMDYKESCLQRVRSMRTLTSADVDACSSIKSKQALVCVILGKENTVPTAYVEKCAEVSNKAISESCYKAVANPSPERIDLCTKHIKNEQSLECVMRFPKADKKIIEYCGDVTNDQAIACVREFNFSVPSSEVSTYSGESRIKACGKVSSYYALQCVQALKGKDINQEKIIEACSQVDNVFSSGCVARVVQSHKAVSLEESGILQDVISCSQVKTAEAYKCITSLGKEGVDSCVKKNEKVVFDENRKNKNTEKENIGTPIPATKVLNK